jgi:ribosomal protein S18 acetylase RimI-like enzyme
VDFENSVDLFLAIAEDVPDEYWRVEHFRVELPLKWELSLAAWIGATPVGYAIVSSPSSNRAHLHHLMLSRELRGCGLGERMLAASLDRAARAGLANFTLKVAAKNSARRFYEKFGFAQSGVENSYLVYQRALSAP